MDDIHAGDRVQVVGGDAFYLGRFGEVKASHGAYGYIVRLDAEPHDLVFPESRLRLDEPTPFPIAIGGRFSSGGRVYQVTSISSPVNGATLNVTFTLEIPDSLKIGGN